MRLVSLFVFAVSLCLVRSEEPRFFVPAYSSADAAAPVDQSPNLVQSSASSVARTLSRQMSTSTVATPNIDAVLVAVANPQFDQKLTVAAQQWLQKMNGRQEVDFVEKTLGDTGFFAGWARNADLALKQKFLLIVLVGLYRRIGDKQLVQNCQKHGAVPTPSVPSVDEVLSQLGAEYDPDFVFVPPFVELSRVSSWYTNLKLSQCPVDDLENAAFMIQYYRTKHAEGERVRILLNAIARPALSSPEPQLVAPAVVADVDSGIPEGAVLPPPPSPPVQVSAEVAQALSALASLEVETATEKDDLAKFQKFYNDKARTNSCSALGSPETCIDNLTSMKAYKATPMALYFPTTWKTDYTIVSNTRYLVDVQSKLGRVVGCVPSDPAYPSCSADPILIDAWQPDPVDGPRGTPLEDVFGNDGGDLLIMGHGNMGVGVGNHDSPQTPETIANMLIRDGLPKEPETPMYIYIFACWGAVVSNIAQEDPTTQWDAEDPFGLALAKILDEQGYENTYVVAWHGSVNSLGVHQMNNFVPLSDPEAYSVYATTPDQKGAFRTHGSDWELSWVKQPVVKRKAFFFTKTVMERPQNSDKYILKPVL